MKKAYYRSDYLFPVSSFVIGMGSVLGMFAPYFEFNYSKSAKDADTMAIESDFGTIGQDIQDTIDSFDM